MLTLNEAADYLGCNPEVLRRKAAAGDVPCTGRARIFRFDRAELLNWIRSQYAEPWKAMFHREIRDIRGSGIYFLMAGESVLYVGQSGCIKRRIREHRGEAKIPFDGLRFANYPSEALDAKEAHFIALLRPPFNVQRGNGL